MTSRGRQVREIVLPSGRAGASRLTDPGELGTGLLRILDDVGAAREGCRGLSLWEGTDRLATFVTPRAELSTGSMSASSSSSDESVPGSLSEALYDLSGLSVLGDPKRADFEEFPEFWEDLGPGSGWFSDARRVDRSSRAHPALRWALSIAGLERATLRWRSIARRSREDRGEGPDMEIGSQAAPIAGRELKRLLSKEAFEEEKEMEWARITRPVLVRGSRGIGPETLEKVLPWIGGGPQGARLTEELGLVSRLIERGSWTLGTFSLPGYVGSPDGDVYGIRLVRRGLRPSPRTVRRRGDREGFPSHSRMGIGREGLEIGLESRRPRGVFSLTDLDSWRVLGDPLKTRSGLPG